jgi:hypothetical protein
MSLTYYEGDAGPVVASITDEDGNPITPIAADATIVNVHTGEEVVTNEGCVIEPGEAFWLMSDSSEVSQTPARYVAYISVTINAANKYTIQVPFDVLSKTSLFAVDRWRRKVEFAAPNEDAISDQEGRDWIDQAVDMLAREYNFSYTSTLASFTPAADNKTVEFVAQVAALMARTAWWAGKGNWRDEEMSFDGTPFEREWRRLEERLSSSYLDSWFKVDSPPKTYDMFNRDRVDNWGLGSYPMDDGSYVSEDDLPRL